MPCLSTGRAGRLARGGRRTLVNSYDTFFNKQRSRMKHKTGYKEGNVTLDHLFNAGELADPEGDDEGTMSRHLSNLSCLGRKTKRTSIFV